MIWRSVCSLDGCTPGWFCPIAFCGSRVTLRHVVVFSKVFLGIPSLDRRPNSIRRTRAAVEVCHRDVVHIKCSSLSSDRTGSPLRCDGGQSIRRLVRRNCPRDHAVSATVGYTARSVHSCWSCLVAAQRQRASTHCPRTVCTQRGIACVSMKSGRGSVKRLWSLHPSPMSAVSSLKY